MDVSSRAVELKKTLKKWEKSFQETHDRKAGRQDIKQAPQRIQDAYKEYSNLKRGSDDAVPEQEPCTEIKPEKIIAGTWGSHLNQSRQSTSSSSKGTSQQTQGDILRQYSKKLHSDNLVKLPKTPSYKKPSSLSHDSTPNSRDKDCFHGDEQDDDISTKDDAMSNPGSIFGCLLDNKISTARSSQKAKHHKDDAVLGVIRAKPPKKHSLKAEWLDSCRLDIQETSRATQSDKNLHHGRTIVKRSKVGLEKDKHDVTTPKAGESSHKLENLSSPPMNVPTAPCPQTSDKENNITEGRSPEIRQTSKPHVHENVGSISELDSFARKTTNCNDQKLKDEPSKFEDGTTDSNNITKKSIKPSQRNSDSCLTHEEGTMETTSHFERCQGDETVSKPSIPKFKMEKQADDKVMSEENWTQDTKADQDTKRLDDVSEDSPHVTVGNLKSKQEMTRGIHHDEQDQTLEHSDSHEKPKKKSTSVRVASSSTSAAAPKRSNLNENFVKLEMKKKRYSRRGLFHMKGEAYKRHVWKQKMQGRSSLGDVSRKVFRGGGGGAWRGGRGRGRGGFNPANPNDKCFKCGQTGHWSSNCYGTGDEKKAEIKEEDFPTLEEAAMAACGIKKKPDESTGAIDVTPDVNIETVYDFPAPPPPIQPLLQQDTDGQTPAAPASVYKALKQMGYSSFRPGQEQAVMRILSGLSTLVVLSTGAGKSLVYQLASLMYSQRSPCITLVISPLVSLMDDQVGGLPDCLTGVRLHSNMTKPQREKVVKEIQAGHVNILLVSPEAIVGGGGMGGGCMPALAQLPPIAFVCIDEVHCLSEWSHNFRPSYLMLCKVLRDRLGVQCMLGLTATATMATAQSVAQHLGIAADPHAIIRGTCLPDNLLLSSSRDINRERALVELLKSHRFCHLPSIIIYCIRREDTERVASLLRTCLPEEELQVTSTQEINQDNHEPPTENQDLGASVKDDQPTQASEDCTDAVLGDDIDKQIVKEEEDSTTCLDEEEQPKEGSITAEVKGTRRSRKTKTAAAKKDKNAAGAKTRRKRKRQISDTDDEYEFKDDEMQDTDSLQKERAETQKPAKKKKKSTAVKKKPKLSKKAALKGVTVVTGVNSVESYHAGMTPAARRRVQTAFMTGRLRIVVATVAFGMGLDKSDVRAVIHFNLPKSFESYVQEIGRAGRDQKPAQCHVFLEPQGKDLCELRRHTYANTVDRYCIKKLVSRLFPPCKCEQARRLYKSTGPTPDASNDNNPADTNTSELSDLEAMAAMEEYESSLSLEESKRSRRHGQPLGQRLCRGHLVAVPIESSVQELDIKEEGISTLLCYLELHPKHWLVTLPPTYSTCTIQCYGGPAQLQQIAKSCPPVAVGIAKNKERGKTYRHANSVEFDVVEVSRCMGWDLSIIKRELRQLQWRQVLGKGWVKSGVMVEFSNLAFLVLAPGDLSDDEQDDLVGFLTSKSSSQERRELDQLQGVHSALHSISHSTYWDCSHYVDIDRSNALKDILKEYFARPLSSYFTKDWDNESTSNTQCDLTVAKAGRARSDVRQFVCMHNDRNFSGRAVARIFHGIASPVYPAQVWGRDRRFWRAHLDFDFNTLLQIATEEILRLR